MHRRHTVALCAALAAADASAQATSPSAARSVVFDHRTAEVRRVRVDYTTLIIVEGVDDERRRQPRLLEDRFAAALNLPPPYVNPERHKAIFGDGPPCLSLPSTHVPFGGSYNAHGICP